METDRQAGRLDLGAIRGKNRPVLVFAPSADDGRYRKQRDALDDQPAGLIDREVVVLEAFEAGPGRVGDAPMAEADAAGLRRDFRVGPGEFVVVLVGKDGAEKARWSEPLSAQEIFGHVDAMPMRQREVHERRHGG